MRTITLELLRHGPAHNQLLSPLTPYLALCENHAAVTLHVPFEHNQFLYRMKALSYELRDEESRLFQLSDTARAMGEILAGIPGLTAESSRENGTAEPLTHLRLILSASELALLPFELALSPNGFPGAGQHLLLQPQMPVCLTREIRRVPGEHFQWPQRPHILFAAAAPLDIGPIPLDQHLQTLQRLITPWVKYYDEAVPEQRFERIAAHLTVLPEATVEAIEEACATGEYTHVHILAHGVARQERYDTRYFLALHDPRDPGKVDYVSGSRLATALRASLKPDSRGLSRPAVVTLASCSGAGVGSVAGVGASIAHALHESGIPIVVAAQFPLSFDGSVLLVEVLYEGLLWGADPRWLLHDLRRRLYSQFPNTHDWASLTAYVSLPPDFEHQLPIVQIQRAHGSIDAAMNHADEVTRRFYKESSSLSAGSQDDLPKQTKQLVASARHRIEEAKSRLERLLADTSTKGALIHGLLASTEKRQAEVIHSADLDVTEALELLRSANNHYWKAFLLDRSSSWAVVQYLSLAQVLSNNTVLPEPQTAPAERPEESPESMWRAALALVRYDLRSRDRKARIWAHASLMELYLLSLGLIPVEDAEERALLHADEVIDLAGHNSFDVYSSRRQILRYVRWFPLISNISQEQKSLATKISEKFPEEVEQKWK